MTPEEMYLYLFNSYKNIVPKKGFDFSNELYVYINECVLFFINEMIKEYRFEVPNVRQKYWIKVKNELDKNI